jgi:hypothetical protein
MKYAVAACTLALIIVPFGASAEEMPIGPPIRAGVDWNGWAAAQGRVFRQGADDEDVARSLARTECERATGRSCRGAIAIPDDGSWAVSVLYCGNTASFVGGSPLGNARDVAEEKAGRAGFSPRDCAQIYPQ